MVWFLRNPDESHGVLGPLNEDTLTGLRPGETHNQTRLPAPGPRPPEILTSRGLRWDLRLGYRFFTLFFYESKKMNQRKYNEK